MSDKKEKKAKSSAEKRTVQTAKRRLRNRAAMSQVKTTVKNVMTAIQNNEKDNLDSLTKEAVRAIDKLKSKGILHKSTASRKVSRLIQRVN
ncbi:MAG: 30S ribosomal protein S20, partial [Nitrospinae bacterium]|nr:30S ribosomal protein S20 [Nitrospinota bacterium]